MSARTGHSTRCRYHKSSMITVSIFTCVPSRRSSMADCSLKKPRDESHIFPGMSSMLVISTLDVLMHLPQYKMLLYGFYRKCMPGASMNIHSVVIYW